MANEPMDFEDKLIAGFGYRPQFKRVLSLFADFSLGYSYMSPMAGFYTDCRATSLLAMRTSLVGFDPRGVPQLRFGGLP